MKPKQVSKSNSRNAFEDVPDEEEEEEKLIKPFT